MRLASYPYQTYGEILCDHLTPLTATTIYVALVLKKDMLVRVDKQNETKHNNYHLIRVMI